MRQLKWHVWMTKKINQTISLVIKQDQKDTLEKEIPSVSFF